MISVKSKQLFKEKKQLRALNLLSKCRKHGGPLSTDNITLLKDLTYEQVATEVSYLKATIASELRLKRRVQDTTTGKYKYINLPIDELYTGIRNVLNPSKDPVESVEELLGKMFQKGN